MATGGAVVAFRWSGWYGGGHQCDPDPPKYCAPSSYWLARLATGRRRWGAVLVHALVDDAEVAAGVAREPLHLLLRAAPLVSATEVTPEHIFG
jgi:hypothetical protein